MSEAQSLIDIFHEVVGPDLPLQLPPRVFEELQFRFVKYEPGKALVCAFPALPQFANPMGMYQGGILGAAFDTAFGSLAALVSKRACTTVSMEQQFIRPLEADGTEYTVEVRLRAVRASFVFLEGSARDRHAKLFATAASTLAPFKNPGRFVRGDEA